MLPIDGQANISTSGLVVLMMMHCGLLHKALEFFIFMTNANIESRMREEYVDACPSASASWSKWFRSSTRKIASRTRSAAFIVAIMSFLWTQGPAFAEERFGEEGMRQYQSINYTISTVVPTYAEATRQTDVRKASGAFHNSNAVHELQQPQNHVLCLCPQKNSGESTRIMLITVNEPAEGGYATNYIDKMLLGPLAQETRGTSLWAIKLFGGLVCLVAAYLAIPYPLTATVASDQQFRPTSTSSICPPAELSSRQDVNTSLMSCSFSKASADGSPGSPIKTLREALPKAADTTSIARKSNLVTLVSDEWQTMSHEDVVEKALENNLALYSLEKVLGDSTRAVQVRRAMVARNPQTHGTTSKLETSGLPYTNYDYDRVMGACCENVIGYLPLPVGVAGPLDINGSSFYLPMATTEGVLVASTNRGAAAINASGGVTTTLLDDGMTRGPALRFPCLQRAAAFKRWLDTPQGYNVVETAFNGTSRFAKLRSVRVAVVGSDVFARFKATTGDAMGMNMISKGVDAALSAVTLAGFEDMQVVSLSGNYCTDKKAAAINWIDGRGKSVCAQANITADVLRRILKTDVDSLVDLNISKNLVGSAVAGTMGGSNAHAANIVTAIFLATGQDSAQNVESSGCLTAMKK